MAVTQRAQRGGWRRAPPAPHSRRPARRAVLLAAAIALGVVGCAVWQPYGELTLAEPGGSIERRYASGTEILRSQGAHSEVHVHLPRWVRSGQPLRLTVMVHNIGEVPLDVDIDRASATLAGRYHELYTLSEWARRVRAEQSWAAFFGGLTAIALTVGGFALGDDHHHGRRSYGYAPALGLSLAYWDLAETDATLRVLRREWRAASKTFLQRHTLAPGTWYGGAVVLDPVLPLWGVTPMLEFRIAVGDDEHRFPLRVSGR